MYARIDNNIPRQPLVMRILVRPVVYRHPRTWGGVCSVAGLWVFVLGVILCSNRFWWGTALIAVGALELWIAYRLLHVPAEAQNGQGAR
jgi:hypothetical protein